MRARSSLSLASLVSVASLALISAVFPAACGSSDSSTTHAAAPFGDGVAVSSKVTIDHLIGDVDVVRDKYGMVHIYATHETDAVRVQGYQLARDRTTQLELLRRTAEGSIAEVAGDSSLDSDIAMRAIGLGRVGQQMYDALAAGSPEKAWLDAYADGISQFNAQIRAGTQTLPAAMVMFSPSVLGPWTGADCLAVARYQSFSLSYDIEDELGFTSYIQAAEAKFSATATDAAAKARRGFLVDTFRFDRPDTTTILPAFPNDTAMNEKAPAPIRGKAPAATAVPPRAKTDSATLASLEAFRKASARSRQILGKFGTVGSNNWIVGKEATANGRPLLANDPHLTMSAPAVFWPVHLSVTSTDPNEALDIAGTAFPGIPGIILGHNEHIAWGATTAYYDVSDAYDETLTADGGSVMFNGAPVALTTAKEIIPLSGGRTYEYDVQIVPHHGPILPTIDETTHHAVPASGKAVSMRWTGGVPTHDIDYVYSLLRAKTVEDARVGLRSFGTGGQNWVFADDSGNIFYSSMTEVPTRDKRAITWNPDTFTGSLPIFVLPGDGTAEWTGYVPEANVPHVKNPATHFVSTSNNYQVPRKNPNDPTSLTLPDGTPMYIGAEYADGYRAGRVTSRLSTMIQSGHLITPDDMASIQADARSPYGAALSPALITALKNAAAEKATAGTHPDLTAIVGDKRYVAATMADILTALSGWSTAEFDTPAGVDLDTNKVIDDTNRASFATLIFDVWFSRMVGAVFSDELAAIGQSDLAMDPGQALVYLENAADRTKLATYDATAKDSILFDDMTTASVTESRDERAIASLLDALDTITLLQSTNMATWRWGRMHTITFDSLVSAWTLLSIPAGGDSVFPIGFPRHGDRSTVDVAAFPLLSGATSITSSQVYSYAEGPSQRFVADLVSGAPAANNALPGGEIWDNTSPHFDDEARNYWRKNLSHPVPFTTADVTGAADSTGAHVVYTSPDFGGRQRARAAIQSSVVARSFFWTIVPCPTKISAGSARPLYWLAMVKP